MAFKAAKCPSCAGDLQLPDDKDKVKCMYCGSDIIVRDAIQAFAGVNIQNILELAKVAQDCGNDVNAYNYYVQALEYDSNIIEAWLGRAECALASHEKSLDIPGEKIDIDKIMKLTCDEAFICYQQAYSIGLKDDTLLNDAAKNLTILAKNVYSDGAWNDEMLKKMCQIFDLSWQMKPLLITAYYMIDECDRSSSIGYSSDWEEKNRKFKEKCCQISADWEKRAKTIDPNWNKKAFGESIGEEFDDMEDVNIPANVNNEKAKSSCFVATATMRDYNHPVVLQLRLFRDEFLKKTYLGRLFIKYYNSFGPYLSKVISKSRFLRILCCYLLVKPLASLTKIIKRN